MKGNKTIKKPKSRALNRVARLLQGRLGRDWRPGVRLPPIKELARQLDCGETNTQRAVAQLVIEGLLVSRPGVGTFVTEAAAQHTTSPSLGTPGDVEVHPSLWSGAFRDKTVEVIAIEGLSTDSFVTEPFRVIESEIVAAGGKIKFTRWDDAHGEVRKERARLDATAEAVVFLNVPLDSPARCGSKQVAVIVNSHVVSVDMPGRYDVVMADSEQGAYLAGRWLRELGYKSACFLGATPFKRISDQQFDPTSTVRLRGFEMGWGQPLARSQCIWRQFHTSGGGAAAVNDFLKLKPRPEVIFAASDGLAIGFIHGAFAHDLRVGNDYHIVGFDGQGRGRQLEAGPLTTVEAPMKKLAQLAVRLLAERLANPDQPVRRVALGCTMFEGKSCLRTRLSR